MKAYYYCVMPSPNQILELKLTTRSKLYISYSGSKGFGLTTNKDEAFFFNTKYFAYNSSATKVIFEEFKDVTISFE